MQHLQEQTSTDHHSLLNMIMSIIFILGKIFIPQLCDPRRQGPHFKGKCLQSFYMEWSAAVQVVHSTAAVYLINEINFRGE